MDQRTRVSTSFSTTGVAAAVRWSRVGPSFVSSELIGLYLGHLCLETCDSCSGWTRPGAVVVAAPISPRLGHLGRVGARVVDLNCSCTTTAKEAEEASAPTPGVCAVVDLLTANRRRLCVVSPPMVSTRTLGTGECRSWSGTFFLGSTFSLEQRQVLDRSNSTDSTQQTTRDNRTHSQHILGPHASALEGGC